LSDAEDATNLDAIFRRESGRLISVLTRILGPGNLELAEDVVQESFVAALRDWSAHGPPNNPSAWLLTAARNRAIDGIRRERTRRTFAADQAKYRDSEWTLAGRGRVGLNPLPVSPQNRAAGRERRARIAQVPGLLQFLEPVVPGFHRRLPFGGTGALHPLRIAALEDHQKVCHCLLLERTRPDDSVVLIQ
jgi:DNA-directed RNA polymerase specialized sigma24 family protein